MTNDKLFFRNPTVESVPGTLDTATNGNPAIQGNNPSQFSNDSETAYTAKYTPAGGNVIQNPECKFRLDSLSVLILDLTSFAF